MNEPAHQPPSDNLRRPDLRQAVRHDLRRYRQREQGHGAFWRSLRVLGAVGWSIVLTTVGGAMLGRYLDHLLNSGLRMTLTLIFVGVILGMAVAWNLIQGTRQ